MKYKKITITFTEAKDRLNRTILVLEGINVELLAIIIGTIFGATFINNFYIIDNDKEYAFCMDVRIGKENVIKASKYYLNDLSNKFIYKYGFEDAWLFDCEIDEEIIEREVEQDFIIIEGKGIGIFENNKDKLVRYLKGELEELEITADDESLGFNVKSYQNFDDKLDLSEENAYYNEHISDNIKFLFEDIDYDLFDNAPDHLYIVCHEKVKYSIQEAISELMEYNERIKEEYIRLTLAHLDDSSYVFKEMYAAYALEMAKSLKNDVDFDEDNYISALRKIK